MKKEYISPVIEMMIEMTNEGILADSQLTSTGAGWGNTPPSGGSTTPTEEQTETGVPSVDDDDPLFGGNLSKGGSTSWDD